METFDLLSKHMLVAGQTGTGKSTFLRTLLLSLMHWTHPMYCKVIVLDPKFTEYREVQDVATLRQDYADIESTIDRLFEELQARKDICKIRSSRTSAKAINRQAFKLQEYDKVMPYIVVVFDEFQDFIENYDSKESIKKLNTICAMGHGFGFSIILGTQAGSVAKLKN